MKFYKVPEMVQKSILNLLETEGKRLGTDLQQLKIIAYHLTNAQMVEEEEPKKIITNATPPKADQAK